MLYLSKKTTKKQTYQSTNTWLFRHRKKAKKKKNTHITCQEDSWKLSWEPKVPPQGHPPQEIRPY